MVVAQDVAAVPYPCCRPCRGPGLGGRAVVAEVCHHACRPFIVARRAACLVDEPHGAACGGECFCRAGPVTLLPSRFQIEQAVVVLRQSPAPPEGVAQSRGEADHCHGPAAGIGVVLHRLLQSVHAACELQAEVCPAAGSRHSKLEWVVVKLYVESLVVFV